MKKNKSKGIDVSILILTWNGLNIIKKTLPSFLKLKTKYNYEIIVVDNASEDNTAEFLKKNYPSVKIFRNDSNLSCSGWDPAIKVCKGRYIMFIPNDVEATPDFLDHLVDTMEQDNNVGMTIPVLFDYYNRKLVETGPDWISRSFYTGRYQGEFKGDVKEAKEILGGSAGLVRKSALDTVGYFYDCDFFVQAQDPDLGLRLRLIGLRSMYVPSSKMYHMESATLKKGYSPKNTYYMERNLLFMFLKICSLPRIVLLLPYIILMRLFALLRDILLLRFKIAIARVKGWLWLLFHASIVYKKRKQTQKLRKVKDSYIFKIFSEKRILTGT